jgi:hypothetical protein
VLDGRFGRMLGRRGLVRAWRRGLVIKRRVESRLPHGRVERSSADAATSALLAIVLALLRSALARRA